MKNESIELWLPYKNKYSKNMEVSNMGRVRNTHCKKMCHLIPNVFGYLRAGPIVVHRAVAELFVKNPDPQTLITVNHLDRNKLNNNASNLQWCTNADNIRHSHNKAIEQMDLEGHVIQTWTSVTEAAKTLSLNRSSIDRALTGKLKTCIGNKWRYKAKSIENPL